MNHKDVHKNHTMVQDSEGKMVKYWLQTITVNMDLSDTPTAKAVTKEMCEEMNSRAKN